MSTLWDYIQNAKKAKEELESFLELIHTEREDEIRESALDYVYGGIVAIAKEAERLQTKSSRNVVMRFSPREIDEGLYRINRELLELAEHIKLIR